MLERLASMQNDYLRENRPVVYEQMVREGKLETYLKEMDAEVRRIRE